MKKSIVSACLLACAALPVAAAPGDITLDAKMAFPESLTSTEDGKLYIGSMGLGTVYRVSPGTTTPTLWLSNDKIGAPRVLGVLADKASDTLWLCANGANGLSMLKSYTLSGAAQTGSYNLPGGGFCNDIALRNGDAFITDTAKGRILKLPKGGKALALWYQHDASDPSLDGLAFQGAHLITNTYNGNHLIRIDILRDGKADKGVVMTTSLPLYQPDGIRLTHDNRLLMVEGRGQDGNGRLVEVTITGVSAVIKVIQDGYILPTAVTSVGNTAYVLEAKLNYQRDPALKDKDPGAFKAYAVPLDVPLK